MVHVAALLTDLHYFFDKDVLNMNPIERMIVAGMTRECAAETAMWYMAQGDDDGLEAYVAALEALKKLDSHHAVPTLQSKSSL